MYLSKISLTNFRNLKEVEEISLPKKGILVAAAPNATGKTNFLESLAVLLRGRSWRARLQECVSWGEDSFIIHGNIGRDGVENSRVAVRYHTPSRKLRIEEGGQVASVVSFYTQYPYVLFLPEDTFLFTRGPAGRRNFLNHTLVSSQGYLSALVQYHRVLRQRNSALKRAATANEIDNWTTLLVEHAEVIWRHRVNFVEFLESHIKKIYQELSGEEQQFELALTMGVEQQDSYHQEITAAFEVEKKYGHTILGPHRDDLLATVGGRLVAVACSRGQVRSLVIALKVLAHRYIKQLTGEEPILLLDDIFSELDEQRQEALLKHLPQTQTVLTCTSVPRTLQNRDDTYLLDLRSIISKRVKAEVEEKVDVAKEVKVDGGVREPVSV